MIGNKQRHNKELYSTTLEGTIKGKRRRPRTISNKGLNNKKYETRIVQTTER